MVQDKTLIRIFLVWAVTGGSENNTSNDISLFDLLQ